MASGEWSSGPPIYFLSRKISSGHFLRRRSTKDASSRAHWLCFSGEGRRDVSSRPSTSAEGGETDLIVFATGLCIVRGGYGVFSGRGEGPHRTQQLWSRYYCYERTARTLSRVLPTIGALGGAGGGGILTGRREPTPTEYCALPTPRAGCPGPSSCNRTVQGVVELLRKKNMRGITSV